jgi:hypothetical protein
MRTVILGALLIAAMICFGQTSEAQIRVQVQTATRPHTDTLYFNVENRVALAGLRSGDSVGLGETGFRSEKDTVLTWSIPAAGSAPRFENLLVIRRKKTRFSKRFVFRDPGKMAASVAGITGPDATMAQILSATKLTVRYPDADFREAHYIVRSFQMATYSKSNLTSLTTSNSASFIPEQLSILKQLQAGERIKFRKIVAGCEGCTELNLPDVIVDIE